MMRYDVTLITHLSDEDDAQAVVFMFVQPHAESNMSKSWSVPDYFLKVSLKPIQSFLTKQTGLTPTLLSLHVTRTVLSDSY